MTEECLVSYPTSSKRNEYVQYITFACPQRCSWARQLTHHCSPRAADTGCPLLQVSVYSRSVCWMCMVCVCVTNHWWIKWGWISFRSQETDPVWMSALTDSDVRLHLYPAVKIWSASRFSSTLFEPFPRSRNTFV